MTIPSLLVDLGPKVSSPRIQGNQAALLAFDGAMQRPDGATVGNTYASKRTETTVYNVHGSFDQERPTGNSAQAGIRRLRKAADAGDERATGLLSKVIDNADGMSIHRACKEMIRHTPSTN